MTASIAYHGEVKKFPRVTAVLETEQTTDGREKVITAAMIERSNPKHFHCECESLGLRPGLTLKELNALGCGCCDGDLYPGRGWMCPRLDRIRRELNA